jgi:hypothetical protein
MQHADRLTDGQRDTTIPLFVVVIHCGQRGNRKNCKIASVLNEVQYYVTKAFEGGRVEATLIHNLGIRLT